MPWGSLKRQRGAVAVVDGGGGVARQQAVADERDWDPGRRQVVRQRAPHGARCRVGQQRHLLDRRLGAGDQVPAGNAVACARDGLGKPADIDA